MRNGILHFAVDNESIALEAKIDRVMRQVDAGFRGDAMADGVDLLLSLGEFPPHGLPRLAR